MVIGSYILIITVNINGLNDQPKDTDWLGGYKNKTPYIWCLQETHLRPRDKYRRKVRGWKKIFHANGNKIKAGVAILISDKIDFKTEIII